MDLMEMFERGGPLMWPILASSLLAAIAFVDRIIALRRKGVLPIPTFNSVINHLEAGDFKRAAQLCREDRSILATVLAAGLKKREKGRDAAKEAMEEAGNVRVSKLYAWTNVLSTVAAIAPLLGLLGTVMGMYDVFDDIAGASEPNIQLLAGGIRRALITTGAGLTVAIPVFVGFRYIESRIDTMAAELEERALKALDRMNPLPLDPTASSMVMTGLSAADGADAAGSSSS